MTRQRYYRAHKTKRQEHTVPNVPLPGLIRQIGKLRTRKHGIGKRREICQQHRNGPWHQDQDGLPFILSILVQEYKIAVKTTPASFSKFNIANQTVIRFDDHNTQHKTIWYQKSWNATGIVGLAPNEWASVWKSSFHDSIAAHRQSGHSKMSSWHSINFY